MLMAVLLFALRLDGAPPPSVPPRVFSLELEQRAARVERCLILLPAVEGRPERGRYVFLPPAQLSPTFGLGPLVFAGLSLLVAHGPPGLQRFMEGQLRPGPAILDGGMGAGLSVAW
jgi:hypothetical protein